jgi:septal ring factor EnvC (AmiA/AmiB activator)
MKKIVLGIIFIAAIFGLFILVQKGIIKWQPLTILFAAVAAPFKFILNWLAGEKTIRSRHERIREQEGAFQEDLESERRLKQQRIAQLQAEIESLDSDIARIDDEMAAIDDEIEIVDTEIAVLDEQIGGLNEEIAALQQKRMSIRTRTQHMSIEERQKQAQQLWGS